MCLFAKGRDIAWTLDPPKRKPYISQYLDLAEEEQGAGTYIFIALCVILVAAVLGCIYEVWRSARKDRRRRAAEAEPEVVATNPQRWQTTPYNDNVVAANTPTVRTVGFKTAIDDDDKKSNGTHAKLMNKEYKAIPNTEQTKPNELLIDKKNHIKGNF